MWGLVSDPELGLDRDGCELTTSTSCSSSGVTGISAAFTSDEITLPATTPAAAPTVELIPEITLDFTSEVFFSSFIIVQFLS